MVAMPAHQSHTEFICKPHVRGNADAHTRGNEEMELQIAETLVGSAGNNRQIRISTAEGMFGFTVKAQPVRRAFQWRLNDPGNAIIQRYLPRLTDLTTPAEFDSLRAFISTDTIFVGNELFITVLPPTYYSYRHEWEQSLGIITGLEILK